MCIYLHVFGLKIPTYGLLMSIGIALGIFMIYRLRSYRSIKKTDAVFTAVFAMIGALLGAKLLYIIVELPHILSSADPLRELFYSGIVFYGGVIGGVIGGLLYTRRYKVPFFDYFDIAAPAICFGHAIGRVGCFCAGCCYGAEAYGSPLAVVYPQGSIAPAGIPLLPTQLFESAFLLILGTVLLLLLVKKRVRRRGLIASYYLIGYGVWRFIIEFFRSDPRGQVFFLSTSQFISIFIVAAGIAVLFGRRLFPAYFSVTHPADV